MALLGAAWLDPAGRFSLDLQPPWRVVHDAAPILTDEALRARNVQSGAGFALRSWESDTLLATRPRVERSLDVDGVMSGDRIAALFSRDQDPAEVGATVYLGPADGVDPALGRWVYLPPGEPRRVWWQVFWRSDEHVHQLVAWCPIEQFGLCADDFRALEGAIHRTGAPPATVLFDSGQAGCGPALRADRARAMRASSRFEEARAALLGSYDAYREAASPPLPASAALRLGELSASDALMDATEACVHRAARDQRACEVREGALRDERDRGFQAAVVACLDADPTLSAAIQAAIAPYLGAP